MSLNLMAIAGGALQGVNGNINVTYLASAGYTNDGTGLQVPQYANPVTVTAQVQPPSGKDLKQIDYLNIQGTTRVMFVYSNPQAVDRVDARGGDLFQFPQFTGMPVDNWLVTAVPETWDVTGGGWTKLYVTLQTDRPTQ